MTQSFNLTAEALRDGEQKLAAAAEAVRLHFKQLTASVESQASKGAAFDASLGVAVELRSQADKFNALVNDLAQRIGSAKLRYVTNADTGASSISKVTGGATSARLAGN